MLIVTLETFFAHFLFEGKSNKELDFLMQLTKSEAFSSQRDFSLNFTLFAFLLEIKPL